MVLRLAMLHTSPIPTALGADDFSYLLLGDTLSHFRLTNPDASDASVFRDAFHSARAEL